MMRTMDNPFRRWFGKTPPAAAGRARAAAAWAASSGCRFALSRDGSGFVIEAPSSPATAFQRIEWGTAQRHYFDGNELRIRGEVHGVRDLQMLVVARSLMVALERAVFEEFTQSNETRIDDQTPEEMRWLVLYPKLPRSAMGRIGETHAALSNLPNAAAVWLEGNLADELTRTSQWLPAPGLLIITVQRQRISLRCETGEPDAGLLDSALKLFEVAQAAARRIGEELAAGRIGSEHPSRWGAPSAMPSVIPRADSPVR